MKLSFVAVTIAVLSLGLSHYAFGQDAPRAATERDADFWSSARDDWVPLPDIFPSGGQMKVIEGNPARGAADFYFRFPAGYGVPMHFHSPVEKVYMDQGVLRFVMFDGETVTLGEGGYARFPERSPHQATCVSETDCLFYLASDGPFDIHLIDEEGRVTRSWSAADE